jgi:A/G-specific adenine glycosylase
LGQTRHQRPAKRQTPSLPLSRSEIARLRRSLANWFRKSARELPWRQTRDPYRIWLSEVLLQQTRIETALPYYQRFVTAFPTVNELATAPLDRVLKLWEGLGYYGRARNLHQAARIIVNDLGGRFPDTKEELLRLPGVGRYTAGAVASIAFGRPAAAVDGNTKRVLARLFMLTGNVESAATTNRCWSFAEALVPPRNPGQFNQALMELGARVCTPSSPQCPACPVRRQCRAYAQGRQHTLPRRSKKLTVPHFEVVAAAIRRNGRYLLCQRPATGMLAGLWEFPGGRIEGKETHRRALTQHVRRQLGVTLRVGTLVGSVEHAYSHRTITLHLYRCESDSSRPRASHHAHVRWMPRAHFDRYALATADRKLLDRL